MASTLASTLYPPLVDTFMPAFVRTGPAQITFSLSPYNTADKIQFIHLSLTDLNSNQSVLQPTNISSLKTNVTYSLGGNDNWNLLFNGIVINDVFIVGFNNTQYVTYDETADLYTLNLPAQWVKQEEGVTDPVFQYNKHYKAQLRLDSSSQVEAISSEYLINNRVYFSEWSSICLLTPILQPSLVLYGFERAETDSSFVKTFTQGMITLSGSLNFSGATGSEQEDERLAYYQAWLYDGTEVVDETGILYPSTDLHRTQIDCLLNADNTVPGNNYQLVVKTVTNNHYELVKEYEISIADFDDEYTFDPIVEVTENFEEGYVSIHVVSGEKSSLQIQPAPGRLFIRRASSIDNFKNWELLACNDEPSSVDVDTTFIDNTVSSLVSYQYAIQFQFFKGTWSKTTRSEIIFPSFYDILLSRGDTQLAVRYNGQITNIKPVVTRSKFDTLGSKYPKFAENAQLNYKQYNLSGLISAEGDFNRSFMSEFDAKYVEDMANYKETFGESYMVRNDSLPDNMDDFLNMAHDTYPHEHWYWERKFREEVTEWLNDGEPKLFRSMPEGNAIVMVTDVSLTPNQNIGRLLYNFTATMCEIGDGYSLDALDAAGIIDTPEIVSQDLTESAGDIVYATVRSLRQVQVDKEINSTENIVKLLTDSINDSYNGVLSGKVVLEDSLTISHVRVEFTDLPQWFKVVVQKDDTRTLERITEKNLSEAELFGYNLIYSTDQVTNQHLFVNKNGLHIFPKDMALTSLQLSDAIVTCVVEYTEEVKTDMLPIETQKETTLIGQQSGVFKCDTWLGDWIKSKYEMSYYNIGDNGITLAVTQRMKRWKNIKFDVTPYTMVDILFTNESTPTNITIGRSGVYALEPYCLVEDIRFTGRRMFLNQVDGAYLDPWEFRVGEQGERNSVFETAYGYKITFNGIDYPFTYESDTVGIAEIPIEGHINYLGDIVRSEYV